MCASVNTPDTLTNLENRDNWHKSSPYSADVRTEFTVETWMPDCFYTMINTENRLSHGYFQNPQYGHLDKILGGEEVGGKVGERGVLLLETVINCSAPKKSCLKIATVI